MEAMTALIGELVKRAVGATGKWLTLGQQRRAAFFKEQVEPVQTIFKQFKDEHMATFSEVRSALKSPETSLESIHELLSTKISNERESWMLFDRMDELARDSRAHPTDLYFFYLAQIRRCLLQAHGSEPVSIVFYGSLLEQINKSLSRVEETRAGRQHSIHVVDEVKLKFQEYCADVDMAYLKLRGESLVA
jgi:hypothetical protein